MFNRIGNALELIRQLRGMNQVSLARAAGVGKSQLSKYVNGKEQPKLESLEKLLAVLRVSPMTFFSVVAFLDHQAARIDNPGEPIPGLEGVPGLGLLPESLQDAFDKVIRALLALQVELVRTTIQGGLRER